jgi:hypothetical protein
VDELLERIAIHKNDAEPLTIGIVAGLIGGSGGRIREASAEIQRCARMYPL